MVLIDGLGLVGGGLLGLCSVQVFCPGDLGIEVGIVVGLLLSFELPC